MKYAKPPLTYEQQADLLISRGLVANRETLIERLKTVNYYRLSGYLVPFRSPDDTFKPGTTFDTVWRRYTFDRRLRLLVLDAIERVEVAVRTRVVYEHVHRYGPFGYTHPANLPNLTGDHFGRLLTQINNETERSHEGFVQHYRAKYDNSRGYLPLWMAAEIMPFGAALTFFRGVSDDIKKTVARSFDQTHEVFESWLLSLNTIRNICAHHARLWNRTLGMPPKIPRIHKHPEWHTPQSFANDRCYAILIIQKYLLRYAAPQSRWSERLRALLGEYGDIPLHNMGFPRNWEDCPIWKS